MIKKLWQKYQEYKNKQKNILEEPKVLMPNNNLTPVQNVLSQVFSNGKIYTAKEEYDSSNTQKMLTDIFDQDKRLIDLSKDSTLYNKIMLEFGEGGSPQEQAKIYAKLKELLSFLPLENQKDEMKFRLQIDDILHDTGIPVKKRIQLLEELFVSIEEGYYPQYNL